MAGLTKERRAAKKAAQEAQHIEEAATADELDDGLVPMVKDGQELRVHGTCVAAHRDAGWVVKD